MKRSNKETTRKKMTRKEFLGTGITAATAFTIIPSYVLGGNGRTAPSDKLNIAAIGVGSQGWSELNNDAFQNENIVALCDVNETNLKRASEKFTKAKTYVDWRIALEQKDIDAVYIASNDQSHAFISVWAMNRGKHVFCQKPLAITVEEARMVGNTYLANKGKIATQMGTQMHAHPNVRRVVELIRGGAIGVPQEAWTWCSREPHEEIKFGQYFSDMDPGPNTLNWDLWVGPSAYHPFNPSYIDGDCLQWNWFWDFGAGQIGDMGSHMMDITFWALDLDFPKTCEAVGSELKNDTCPFWLQATWEHPANSWRPAVKIHWSDGGKKPEGIPETDRFKAVVIKGDKGYLVADYGYRKIWYNNGETAEDDSTISTGMFPDTEGPITHYQEWIDASKNGGNTLSNFDYAGKLIEHNLLALVAYRVKQKINWDAANLKATNCTEADKYVGKSSLPGPTYRQGWTLNG
ncbi:MAG TPA: Gfo/Idh/MocA family oxidoreductase [Mariniphaga anaerophila]|uniref:Gfo/Idh/MocA family oxidoreductase n=1 Tax=Mariniphaga anaerophila TaxID=1484053 RepID=A0A831LMR3_9BACT|nr:Gfo/Idh/MocA family oxidoreductase [Mariniphaga anaerophila]